MNQPGFFFKVQYVVKTILLFALGVIVNCRIIRIHGASIFVIFAFGTLPRINILDVKKRRKVKFFNETKKPTHPQIYTSPRISKNKITQKTTKQKKTNFNPRKLANSHFTNFYKYIMHMQIHISSHHEKSNCIFLSSFCFYFLHYQYFPFIILTMFLSS